MSIPANIQNVIDRLHAEAAGDSGRWALRRGKDETDVVRMGEMYLAVSPDEGRFLYMLALKSGARHVVEFGASFGVSTLYLAAAMARTGGHVTTTEVHPAKCAALSATFAEAGVSDHVTLLEGDARETLRGIEPGVDLLLLDGWKGMYQPILDVLRPKLAPGALVAADNIDHAGAQSYLDAIRGDADFMTTCVGDMGLSMLLPK